jgi:DNA-binding transcriptional LysR family regulator
VAQTALSTQIQDLEAELGFKLFDRLPRGVKLSAAGRLYLEDARRILQQVSEAGAGAARVARGQTGTLRVGFTENASWHGIVPDSFQKFRERQPEAELQLSPSTQPGTNRGHPIRTAGRRVRVQHAEERRGIGPACRGESMSNLPRLKGIL